MSKVNGLQQQGVNAHACKARGRRRRAPPSLPARTIHNFLTNCAGVLAIALTLRGVAIDVINQFLQLIEAHRDQSNFSCSQSITVLKIFGIAPMWPPGNSRIVFGIAMLQEQIKILERHLLVFLAVDDQQRRAGFVEPALVEQRQRRHDRAKLVESFLAE